MVAGFTLRFKNTTANTGAVTLNVNGLGAKPIVKNGGVALSAGDLKASGVYTVVYDGSNFIVQSAVDLSNQQSAIEDIKTKIDNMVLVRETDVISALRGEKGW